MTITEPLTIHELHAAGFTPPEVIALKAGNFRQRVADMRRALGGAYTEAAIMYALQRYDDAQNLFGWPDARALAAARDAAIYMSPR